jgi:hypothetical protein
MHLVVLGFLLLVFATSTGRHLAAQLLKIIVVVFIATILFFKGASWWLYDPSSPGYNEKAVNDVRKANRIDEKRRECNNVAPMNWDEECRHLMMGND